MKGGVAANVILGQSWACERDDPRRERPSHLVVAALALHTGPASVSGLEGDPVADSDARISGDLGAELDDGAGRLVAETHGLLDDKVPDLAVLEVMDVRAADARLGDGDEDLVALELGDRALWTV